MKRELLSTAELAGALGVSRRWIYQQVAEHDLPAYRLGPRALRYDLNAVRAWLDQRRIGDWHPTRSCGNPISRVPI
jgi:excisionase family DNA binding protein